MKRYIQARVLFSDAAYLGERENPMTATVFMSGNNAVVNVDDERVDRIVDAEWSEKGDTVTIAGRSEYLEMIGLAPEDQQISIEVKGGGCTTC